MSKVPASITIDARQLLMAGEEPLQRIKAASENILPGQTLIVISPFIPSPLIERLQANGFSAQVSRRHDGAWETHFQQK